MEMLAYERRAKTNGFAMVCGCDEAGAGPVAGPVSGAAVILPEDFNLPGLDDSKKLSEKKREALFPLIIEQAIAYAIAFIDAKEIDETDILSARMKVMQTAIDNLQVPADYALIDGNRDKGKTFSITTPHETIVKGDSLSASIAAASILAKVSRDRMMIDYDGQYPQYGFAKHKGYGTAFHVDAIMTYGYCPIHRKTFKLKQKQKKQEG